MKRNCFLFLTALLLASMLLCACGNAAPTATAILETTAAEEPETRSVLKSNTIEQFMGDLTITMKSEYFYDENGFMTEIISYSNGEEVSRTTVESNEHGVPIRQTTVSGDMTTITESECIYEGDILMKQTDTVTANGTVTNIREYVYTPEGKVLEATFTTLGENGYTSGNRYEYDENGNQTAEIYVSTDGSEARKETEYNENGKPIRSVTTNADGIVTTETEYIYLEDGSVKTVSGQSWGLNTYNEQGNPLVMETYNGDTLAIRITYTYITIPAFK